MQLSSEGRVSLTTQSNGPLGTKLRGQGPNSTLWGGDNAPPWPLCCLGVSLGSVFYLTAFQWACPPSASHQPYNQETVCCL